MTEDQAFQHLFTLNHTFFFFTTSCGKKGQWLWLRWQEKSECSLPRTDDECTVYHGCGVVNLQAVWEIREWLKTEFCDSFRVSYCIKCCTSCLRMWISLPQRSSLLYLYLLFWAPCHRAWVSVFYPPQEEPKLHVKVQPIKSISFIITKKSSSSFLEILSCCLGRHVVIFCFCFCFATQLQTPAHPSVSRFSIFVFPVTYLNVCSYRLLTFWAGLAIACSCIAKWD